MKKVILSLVVGLVSFSSCTKNDLTPTNHDIFVNLGDTIFSVDSDLQYIPYEKHVVHSQKQIFVSNLNPTKHLQKWEIGFSTFQNHQTVMSQNWYSVVHHSDVEVDSNIIKISATKLPTKMGYVKANGDTLKSIRYTKGHISGSYMSRGYLEFDCLMPKGKNLWNAAWLYGTAIPGGGDIPGKYDEIDIFESFSGNDGDYRTQTTSPYNTNMLGARIIDGIKTNVIGGKGENRISQTNNGLQSANSALIGDPTEVFQHWELEWDVDFLGVYLNDVLIFSMDEDVPSYSMRLQFNSGVDYNVGSRGWESEGTTSPMVIKNVKYDFLSERK